MKSFKIYLLLLLPIIAGCTTSRITHSWKAENAAPKKYNKILVLGLSGDPDIRIREKMENHIVGDLSTLGYSAVSGLKEYGPKSFRDIEEGLVMAELEAGGFDAVITIAMLNKSQERNYIPGHVHFSPYAIYQRRFYGYYTTIFDRIYSPGYYAISTRYFWESNLYDLETKELLYSVQTESFDPPSIESLGHEYGKLIVQDMVNKRVLTKPQVLTSK